MRFQASIPDHDDLTEFPMPIPFDFTYRESHFLAAHYQSKGTTLHAYPDVELDLPSFSEHELRFMTLREQREEAAHLKAEEEGAFLCLLPFLGLF